jgi:hypothetical protein
LLQALIRGGMMHAHAADTDVGRLGRLQVL